MKKIIALILTAVLLLSLTACGKPAQTQPETTQAETEAATEAAAESTTVPATQPLPTEPAWEPGVVRADGLGVVWTAFQRGDAVTVLGEWNGYYVVEGEDADLIVDAWFLRTEKEAAPEETKAWAKAKTKVYRAASLQGDPIATLNQNTRLQVKDARGNWCYIEWTDGSGYISASQVSQWQISGGSGGGGGSSGSGGGQDGTDVNIGGLAATGTGGYGIVTLGSYSGPKYEKYPAAISGQVLSDETPGYLCLLQRGTEAKITEAGEMECSILVGDLIASIPRWAVKMENDEGYETWTAFTKRKAKAYSDIEKQKEVKSFQTNEKVEVVDKLEELELYVVELDEGFAYMKLSDLSEKRFASGGGSGGQAAGGGGASGWTPPVL